MPKIELSLDSGNYKDIIIDCVLTEFNENKIPNNDLKHLEVKFYHNYTNIDFEFNEDTLTIISDIFEGSNRKRHFFELHGKSNEYLIENEAQSDNATYTCTMSDGTTIIFNESIRLQVPWETVAKYIREHSPHNNPL